MKKSATIALILSLAIAGLALAQGRGAAQAPPPTGPIADAANAQVLAMNKNDAAFFESKLAPEVVWLDEDGHAIVGKESVLNRFVKGKLLTGNKKVTITGLRVGNTADAGWASYMYTLETTPAAGGAPTQRRGTQTTVYKKVGNDWQIVLVHGAVNFPAGHQ